MKAGKVDRTRRSLLCGAGALAVSTAPRIAFGAPAEKYVLDAVIIGGGLAGLTAARDLFRAGNESFVVLEARNRVGGRTLNHRLRDGYISEAGGQWIGPGQTAVADLARELGIDTFDSEYAGKAVFGFGSGHVPADTHGEFQLEDASIIADLEAMAKRIDPIRPWASKDAAELDRISLGSWLQSKKHASDIDFLTYKFASMLTVGSGIFDISLLYYLAMLRTAGGVQRLEAQKGGAQEKRFHGGSQLLSIRMAELLAPRVLLEHPVSAIEDWDKPVVRITAAGQVFKARTVIVALSPPLCNRITFAPALPAQRAELQRRWPAHAPMIKSAAVYPSPFWLKEGFNGQVAAGDGPIIWSYDNSPPDKALGVINAFHRLGEMPANPEEAKAAVVKVYADAMKDDRFLHPLEFHLQDWGQEPYTITCVSPMPPGFLTSGLMPALNEPAASLIWAGTETAEIWFGYMDGAVRSGHRAALTVLQRLQSARRAIA